MHRVSLTTTRGNVDLEVWDTAGRESLAGLKEAYYIGADAAIIMFSLDNRGSYKNVTRWYKEISKICRDIPIILVGNKADIRDKLRGRQISFQRAKNLQYFDISVKTNYQYEKPFLWVLKNLLGDRNLRLLANKAIHPQPLNELNTMPEYINRLRREIEEAQEEYLPD